MAPLVPESVSPRDILSRLAQSAPAVHINHPTRTLSEVASKVLPRQATTTVVSDTDTGSNTKTLSGGAIAGIVIGSIAGFLLILWLIRSCTNLGNTPGWGQTFEPKHEKPATYSQSAYPYHHETHRSRSRHSRHGGHSPRRSVEVRPVYYEGGHRSSRGRSPRAPPPVYTNGAIDGRDLRRSSGSRRHRY